ncbi:ORF MSV173 putative serine/threonine protein kinase Swinepox virus C20L homolog (vaccinia F10L), similar to SW:P32216 [Melanoplus sanguinipes entomopoxvirus]|uniref:Serine/threonine-protein kinase n=1 Tax=Melanoplus sanguinipes entomopoxvirus TaxID=83191 RepID=Q9YVR9_MSEPV|nr:ORF MSV173 putative serine/threonine protein kinase Swinepox virus C20L homolog (vaccinia F10L), similar to SW:P32216 [Melanoplus sanguinipes entomopoxvirus]AAC97687.1 ORF MSV173 putative serine/threonine protein kinase Swinepox virus C20L homolog (vaccinia F10L), similar to SW:P32216 [Melanoplus sanguinipes entomopoxvirus 'O']
MKSTNCEGNLTIIYLLSKRINEFRNGSNGIINTIRNIVKEFSVKEKSSFIKMKKQMNIIKNEISNMNEEIFLPYFMMNTYALDDYIYHISTGAFGMTFRATDNFILKFIINPINNQYHEFIIPHKLYNILKGTGCENFILVPCALIKQIDIKHLMNIIIAHNIIFIFIKHIINPTNDINIFDTYLNFDKMIKIYKEIISYEDFYKYFTYFYKKYFKDLFNIILINNYYMILSHVKHILTKMLDNSFSYNSSLIISNLAICASNELKLIKISENGFIPDMINGIPAQNINPNYLRHIVLQVLLIIYYANKDETIFIHNDIKPNNILVFPKINDIVVKFGNCNIIFKEKYYFKLTDFDLSYIKDFKNERIKGIINEKYDNFITDIFYFLYRFKHDFFKNLEEIDPALNKAIIEYFMKYIHKKDIVDKYHYVGSKKFYSDDVYNFIMESGLFKNWIHKLA